MDQTAITIRDANPNEDEGLACGRYLDEAAEGFFRFMLGNRAEHIVARAYVQTGHTYSFQNVIFAERNNQIVGMALGFTSEQHRQFSDRPIKEAAGFNALRMRAVQILLAPLFRILKTIDDGDFYLLSIAIDKEIRGGGIGSTLMDAMEERGRACGSKRLSLDVAAGNEGARRFYERRGMTIVSQWPKRLPMPGLKFYRMAKAL